MSYNLFSDKFNTLTEGQEKLEFFAKINSLRLYLTRLNEFFMAFIEFLKYLGRKY